MASQLWNPFPSVIMDGSGNIAAAAKAYFYYDGTSQPLTVYSDYSRTTPHSWPVEADANGVFDPIYLPFEDYRVRLTTTDDALIYDADGISNPEPPTSGGGGGIVVAQEDIWNTGDINFGFASSKTGWVRMNARTIGSAISGATERANADTEDLFTYLWTNVSDTYAPVSTGRGASAAADWAANKTIGVPTMQGYIAAGLDDMGGTAANVLQVSTTASVTNGSPTVTVVSATGLARGMYVIINSVAAGQIISISGTTVTLDTNYAGTTNASRTFRASFFSDAQTVGVLGGGQSTTLTTTEMPAHTHGVTDPGHTHLVETVTAFNASVAPGGLDASGTEASGASLTGITIQSAGSGLPARVLQPTRLFYFFMKL